MNLFSTFNLRDSTFSFYDITNRLGLYKYLWTKQIIFVPLYFLIKKYIEDPFFDLVRIRPIFFKGGHILDIGANIGYTSFLFSKAVQPEFKVFSFEPDLESFELLDYVINKNKLHDKVIPLQVAVGDIDGVVEFWHNPKHQADHKVLTKLLKEELKASKSGIKNVPMISIDSFIAKNKIDEPIKFIKIDVQGYELPVCIGMKNTLKKNPQAVVVLEYSPHEVAMLGFDQSKLLEFFKEMNYNIYLLHRKGVLEPLTESNILEVSTKRGFTDILCTKEKIA